MIHEQNRSYAYPLDRCTLILRLLTEPIPGLSCSVVCWNRFSQDRDSAEPVSLNCYARDKRFSYHEAEIVTSESSRYFRYYFVIRDQDEVFYLSGHGVGRSVPSSGFFEYLCTNEEDIFAPPEWARNAVFYEIFPERFCNGDKHLNPASIEPWGGIPTEQNFFGGDLRGIIRRFDHIVELGVDVLYLTPIFYSPSNHKYDTIDYFRIDPHFGTLEDLQELTALSHEHGLRVVLDGVFNHCGYHSTQFQDFLDRGEESGYADWFYAREFPLADDPLNYECVGYHKWMPKLRFASKEVRNYFLKVGEHWIKTANIDGWRLDVADEVDYTFWQEFRKHIKSVKPDAFLLGETWGDGRNLLEGDQMDSVMNYLFRDAVLDFVARKSIDAAEFDDRTQRAFGMYKRMALPSLYNLLGSHDTARLFTECGEDIKTLSLAVVLQMTFPGAPAIYYGDELGMTGQNDPGCRQTMAWENPNHDVYSLFRDLVALRKNSLPLYRGILKTLYCNGAEFAYARQYGDENVYVVINNSDRSASVPVPVLETDVLTYASLVGERVHECSCRTPEVWNPDLVSCNACVEVRLGSYCFEIFTRRSER